MASWEAFCCFSYSVSFEAIRSGRPLCFSSWRKEGCLSVLLQQLRQACFHRKTRLVNWSEKEMNRNPHSAGQRLKPVKQSSSAEPVLTLR